MHAQEIGPFGVLVNIARTAEVVIEVNASSGLVPSDVGLFPGALPGRGRLNGAIGVDSGGAGRQVKRRRRVRAAVAVLHPAESE